MSRWSWNGLFSISIPEDWVVNEPGDLIELIPPHPNTAAHISVLRRTKELPVRPDEARVLIAQFASRRGRLGVDIEEDSRGDVLVGRCVFRAPDTDGAAYWLVHAYVAPNRAVLCSLCSFGEDIQQIFAAVAAVFDSIDIGPASSASATNRV